VKVAGSVPEEVIEFSNRRAFLTLGRWRFVSFTFLPLRLRESTRYPMDMNLNVPQAWFQRVGEETYACLSRSLLLKLCYLNKLTASRF
jgi:hypothetical protein